MSIDTDLQKWEFKEEVKYELNVEDIYDKVHQDVGPKSKKSKVEEQNYYQCTECEYKSPSKRILRTHKKNKHSVEYPCDQCKYKVNSKSGLENHIASKHGGICYICELCRYNTNNVKTFMNHKVYLPLFTL